MDETKHLSGLLTDLQEAVSRDNESNEEYDRTWEDFKALYYPKPPGERGMGELRDQTEEGYRRLDGMDRDVDDLYARCDATESDVDECRRLIKDFLSVGQNIENINWQSLDVEDDSLLYCLILWMRRKEPDFLNEILQQLLQLEKITQEEIDEAYDDLNND